MHKTMCTTKKILYSKHLLQQMHGQTNTYVYVNTYTQYVKETVFKFLYFHLIILQFVRSDEQLYESLFGSLHLSKVQVTLQSKENL